MRSGMSAKERARSEGKVIILKDWLREHDPKMYEWLYGKPRGRPGSAKKTSSTD